jgi:hypothetical protein
MPIALVVIGAIVIVAVAARYAPAAAGARSRDAILAECAQLIGQLAAVRQ